jgi:hypothetical protein
MVNLQRSQNTFQMIVQTLFKNMYFNCLYLSNFCDQIKSILELKFCYIKPEWILGMCYIIISIEHILHVLHFTS